VSGIAVSGIAVSGIAVSGIAVSGLESLRGSASIKCWRSSAQQFKT